MNESTMERFQSQMENTRRLGGEKINLCTNFRFEYSIDGQVTRLSRDEFLSRLKNIQRVVNIITLFDKNHHDNKDDDGGDGDGDENNKNNDNGNDTFPKYNIQVAVRIVGCGRQNALKLTHIYWA